MRYLILVISLFLFTAGVSARTLIMAAEDDFYPFSAEVDGELVGMVPEVARAAFEAVGVNVEFRVGPFKRVLSLVEAGKVVGGFTGAIDDSNRSRFYWHETPLGSVVLAIWARSGSGESGLTAEDMVGQRLSVTRGFYNGDKIDANPDVAKLVAPSDESSLKMLVLGRSDYALVTQAIGRSIVQKATDPVLRGQVEIVGTVGEMDLYAFFSKAHPQGREAAGLFQQGLETILANGIYDRIARKWLGRD